MEQNQRKELKRIEQILTAENVAHCRAKPIVTNTFYQ